MNRLLALTFLICLGATLAGVHRHTNELSRDLVAAQVELAACNRVNPGRCVLSRGALIIWNDALSSAVHESPTGGDISRFEVLGQADGCRNEDIGVRSGCHGSPVPISGTMTGSDLKDLP